MNSKGIQLFYRLLEIIGWILFCSLPVIFLQHKHADGREMHSLSLEHFLIVFLIKNIKFIVLFYIHSLVLIPYFYAKGKYKLYFFYLAILFFLVAAFPFITELFVHHEPMPPHHDVLNTDANKEFHHPPFFRQDRGMHFFMAVIVLILPFLLHIYRQFVSSQKEKAQMELMLLKNQINHHFLFNSLNSIYALTVQNSIEAPNAVHSLSYIMRHVLDETSKNKIFLKKEIEYIQHYIALQKLRLNEKVNLQFNVEGNVDKQLISPMMLIPFIENCFKHGISSVQNADILISIMVDNNHLVLKTTNSIFENHQTEEIKSGLGIPNVLKRLEHDYLGNYTYEHAIQNQKYLVELKVNLI